MNREWEVKKLGEVCEVVAGQSPESKYYNNIGEGIPFYQGKKEFSNKFIGKPTTWTTKITKEAQPGDILMSVRAPVGPVNFSKEKICIGRGLAAIRASKSIDREYLFNFLLKHEKDIVGNAGAVFNSINKKQIENILIPLPDITEQQRIVAILNESFYAIESARRNAEKNLQNAREIFESYLQSVFINSGNDWEKKKLGELCIVERGSSPRPIKKYITTNADGVNWIKIGDTKGVDKYIYSTNEKITQEGANKSRFVKEGDFILSNSMSFGKPFIMKTTGYIHDGWFVLRLQSSIDIDYLYYLLISPFVVKQFNNLASGAIVKNISSDLVKKVIIPFPSFAEQQRIVVNIEKLLTETKKLEDIYNKKLIDLEELKKSILQKAFNGEL